MNGQYFNSTGSGNGTPTPHSNSSYPASLSSQSSRDPSPPSRDSGLSPYAGHEQKTMPPTLANNISGLDHNRSPLQSTIYTQKLQQQQQFLSNAPISSQDFTVNHNNLTNSNFNSANSSQLFPDGENISALYNSRYSSAANHSNTPNVPFDHQSAPNRNPYHSVTSTPSNAIQSDVHKSINSQPPLKPSYNVHSLTSQSTGFTAPFQNVPPSSTISPVINSTQSHNKDALLYNSQSARSINAQPVKSASPVHNSHSDERVQLPKPAEPLIHYQHDQDASKVISPAADLPTQNVFASSMPAQQRPPNNFPQGAVSSASPIPTTSVVGSYPPPQSLQSRQTQQFPNASPVKRPELNQSAEVGSGDHSSSAFLNSSPNRQPASYQFPPTSKPVVGVQSNLVNQPPALNNSSRSLTNAVPTAAPQYGSNLGQSSVFNQQFPPNSTGSKTMPPGLNRPGVPVVPPNPVGPSRLPQNSSLHQLPPPPTNSNRDPIVYQTQPPRSLGPYQQTPPSSYGSQNVPPTSTAPLQQYPPTSLSYPAATQPGHQLPPPPGASQERTPPAPGQGYYPSGVAPLVRNPPPYQQGNQVQQIPQQGSQTYPPQSGYSQQAQPNSSAALSYGVNRYPQMAHNAMMDGLTNQLRGSNITQDGFNRLWGMDTFDLLKTRDLIPNERVESPQIRINPEAFDSSNCNPELFRCTLTKIPENKSLLEKSRLPFGVLIHPFKDLNQLSVVQCSTIVRCRSCRTYINPFVYFVDNKRWKCNLCFRVNELPDEFQFDPVSKTYGDPSRRPEIKFATIEFIAPSEYMVRPPQPAIYLFLLDVSRFGAESGYLEIVCQTILEELGNLPGDARTSVGFITYDSNVQFYSLAEGLNQPHQMVVVDIEDMFLPCPENLLVNLDESQELIKDLLTQLPKKYAESYDTDSALGAALQAAYKLLCPTGGRITVFQSRLPNVGPGALIAREDPSQRAGDSVAHLNPATDFYKKLALDCSSQQIAVDLFLVNAQYVDVATLSGVSRFSGGCMYHFPLFRTANRIQVDSLKRTFQRYLVRKIGLESVMRLRCTRGLSIHTFHGNFFVRSTDLLSLPNVNPDAGFGMQVSIDESLSELQNVCFQAALLYTSSKGERRIRVHTLCLPVVTNLSDILNGADQYCIVGLLAKMAVDRSIESSLTDAREAFVNVVADILNAFKLTQNTGMTGCLLAPKSLRLIPMYILALLKSVPFRTGQSTRLDDRVFGMCQMKSLPLASLLQCIYPDLYPIHNLHEQPIVTNEDGHILVPPQRLHLSSEKLDSQGVFLLDNGTVLLIYVGHNVNPTLCQNLFGVPHFTALPQEMYELPELNTPENERLRDFVYLLQTEKSIPPCLQIIGDNSPHRGKFLECLVEDKNESGSSYYEFVQRIKVLMK